MPYTYRLMRDALTPEAVLNCFDPDEDFLTRRQIAARLGVSVNKTLVALIEHMVSDGTLTKGQENLTNGAVVFIYGRT